MALGHHIIFSAHGFWLPNDPRGSWSVFGGCWELFRYGPATKTGERRSTAWVPHDTQRRLAAKTALKRPPIQFNGLQARAVGEGFKAYALKNDLEVWACAILRDHVHLVVGPYRLSVRQLVTQLKGDATQQLVAAGLHPFQDRRRPD